MAREGDDIAGEPPVFDHLVLVMLAQMGRPLTAEEVLVVLDRWLASAEPERGH